MSQREYISDADRIYSEWGGICAALMDAGGSGANDAARKRLIADTFTEAAALFTPQIDTRLAVQTESKAVRG